MSPICSNYFYGVCVN
jgi:hypothetical protein